MASTSEAKQADGTASSDRAGTIQAGGRAGAYGVLAGLTAGLEAVLLAWLAYAGSEAERITAGILMASVLLALICVIGWIEFIRRPVPPLPPLQQAVTTLDKEGLPQREIETAEQREPDQLIAARDASYVIARPPPDWTVRVSTIEAIIEERIGSVSGLVIPAVSSVLLLEFGAPLVWTPQPDRMRINGRRFPLLLPEPLGPPKLQIVTLRRRQPPLYIERTLYDTLVTQIASIVQMGMVTLASITPGKLPKTNREMIVVEMSQKLENIMISDREVDILRVNIGVTVIRGDLYDYLLVAVNLRIGRGVDPAAERVDTEFAKLFDSFRLLSVADPAAEARKDSESAEHDFVKYLSTYGPKFFERQFKIAADLLAKMDLNSAAGVARAVVLLRPFRTFANMLQGADFHPNALWTALDQAERGDTRPLRDFLRTNLTPPPADSSPAIAPSTH